jgi:hypothetical protein
MDAKLGSRLPLLESEVEPALENVVADVLQLVRMAWNRARSPQFPPKGGVRNSVRVPTRDIPPNRACAPI